MTKHSQQGSRIRAAQARPMRTVETALVLLIIVALFAVAWLSGRPGGLSSLETQRVRVRGGDSLWSLASEHRIPGKTTAETVDVLADVNGLTGSTLAAGTVIDVPLPAEESADRMVAAR